MRRDWTQAVEKCREEGACRKCGRSDLPIDPAHVTPRSRGAGVTADEVVPLCRPCHTLYDAGRLELLPVLTTEEQVAAVEHVGIAEAYRRTTVWTNG